jgi:hypothetical protein
MSLTIKSVKAYSAAFARCSFSHAAATSSIRNGSETSFDKAAHCIELEDRHGAHNYHPLPVVLASGKGMYVAPNVSLREKEKIDNVTRKVQNDLIFHSS